MAPWDCYDALQRGLIDSTQMGLAPMVSMGWQDVASYWALDGTFTAGNMFTANLEWWNSLTDAQRQAIQQATFDAKADSAMATAEANGKAEGMTKILEVAAQFTGYDWQH